MSYEERDNEIRLFLNDKKKGPKDPDLKGSGIVNGWPCWASGWKNTSKNGVQYDKIVFQFREPQQNQQQAAPQQQNPYQQYTQPQGAPPQAGYPPQQQYPPQGQYPPQQGQATPPYQPAPQQQYPAQVPPQAPPQGQPQGEVPPSGDVPF